MVHITPELKETIEQHPIAGIIDAFRKSLPRDVDQCVSDVKQLTNFLTQLCLTEPADRITLTNPNDRLKSKLLRLILDLDTHATIPTTLKPLCSSLLEMVASRPSDLDFWTAVAELFEARDPTVSGASSGTTVGVSSSVVQYLRNDWSNKFIGNSLDTLRTVIQDFEGQHKTAQDEYYSRTLVFLQSSGMGKSRLADTFGQSCPMINYVLREEGATGYPPADNEIRSLMQMDLPPNGEKTLNASPENNRTKSYPSKRAETIWYHSLAVGVLQASFEELYKWVEELYKRESPPEKSSDLAALRHTEMAHNSGAGQKLTDRPEKRVKFCMNVAKRAKEIAIELIGVGSWRRAFDSDEGSAIRYELASAVGNHLGNLWDAAKRLTNKLGSLEHEDGRDPLLVVVFDEASSLLKGLGEGKTSTGRYVALNRIMSCLREYRIWFFIISTESQVGAIVPPDDVERSGDNAKNASLRIAPPPSEARLKRIPPFLAFPLDIEDVEAMQHSGELDKKLSDFGDQRHMAMFGRRLWYAYIGDPQRMNTLAKQKLIGGVRSGKYQATDIDHVFAALSFRLSLDACLYNTRAVNLIRDAVNSHMRVVLAMDHSAGIMHTVSPSEPIIAKAAMEYLCTATNWATSIVTLVTKLIEKGIVEKGLKGELYARWVLILAHDWIRCCRRDPHRNPYFLATFTVREFLTTLYDETQGSIANIQSIDKRILQARMNFTHFVPTHENLRPEVFSDLFVDLLRRSAALQLAPGQAMYDILIPIYFGNQSRRFNPSKCGCIVVQVKNKNEGTTPGALFGEDFTNVNDTDAAIEDNDAASSNAEKPKAKKRKTTQSTSSNAKPENAPENASTDAKEKKKKEPVRDGPYFVFNKMKMPILYLLFDLGFEPSAAAPIEVSYSSKDENIPRVWVIHSRGHTKTVFGCLGLMDCTAASDSFFEASVLGPSLHDQVAQRYNPFYELDRSFRYPSAIEGTEDSETQSGVEGGVEHGSKTQSEVEGGVEHGSRQLRRRGQS